MSKILLNFPISKITTLKIGGPAKEFIVAKFEKQLINIIKSAKRQNKSYIVIGGGSNLLVSDEGFDGLIIQNQVEGIEKTVRFLKVKSGTRLQNLVNFSIKNNLAGLENLTDIPGTLGGAVYGNAGAFGQTISDHLWEVSCFDGVQTITLLKDECNFDYRTSGFKQNGYTILEVTFKLKDGDGKQLEKRADEILKKREVKYPKGIKCPGSFFMNLMEDNVPSEILKKIPKDKIVFGKVPAGVLLELVGAKGAKLGSVEIAPYHANLFVNKNGGRASDFYSLAKKYHKLVKEKFGISLEPEVQLINLPPLQ